MVYKLCGSKQYIDSLIKDYQSSVINKCSNIILSQQIYSILLPAILEKSLIISPDAGICSISFDGLSDNRKMNNYLIYRHVIQYSFSASTYFIHRQLSENKNVVAFFPEFLNTSYAVLNNKKEKKTLSTFFDYESINGSSATKEVFIQKCKNTGIIHIASHLLIDTISPLQSSLIFQPGKKNYALTITTFYL